MSNKVTGIVGQIYEINATVTCDITAVELLCKQQGYTE